MARKSRVFTNTPEGKERIRVMLDMRERGYPYSLIAKEFGVDHTTIVHHCKKYGVTPSTHLIKSGSLNKLEPIKEHKYASIIFEPVNIGKKTYKDYLAEAQSRGEKISLPTFEEIDVV